MISDFYGRKSTDDAGRSVASQEADWRADCATQGLEPGRVFADPGLSASRYAKKGRPDYDALLAHIRAGGCELLSLWECSRGSRDLADWVALLDLCRKHGTLIRAVSHGRTYDVRVRRDWRTLADEGVDSADESEKISERTTRGKRTAAAAGRPAGRLTYGYTREYDGAGRYVRQVIDPEKAAVVREIVASVRDGVSISAIARGLNDRAIPAPEGGQWRSAHIGRIATNPAYAARRVHRGEVVGPADWPAILDDTEHHGVVAVLRDPARRVARGTALRWPLSGVALCGVCEVGRLRTHRGGAARSYLCDECKRIAISADPLDDFVSNLVCERLRQPDALAVFAPPPDDVATAAAQAEERALRERLDDHYTLAAAGQLSAGGLAAVEARLLPLIAEAVAKVRRLSAPRALRSLVDVDVAGTWTDLPVSTRRDVIVALVDLHVGPAVRGRPRFDRGRLAASRWVGDARTWGELWSDDTPWP